MLRMVYIETPALFIILESKFHRRLTKLLACDRQRECKKSKLSKSIEITNLLGNEKKNNLFSRTEIDFFVNIQIIGAIMSNLFRQKCSTRIPEEKSKQLKQSRL